MIETAGTDVIVTIHVIPRASRSMLAGTRDGALLVRLQAPPVEGAANDALVELLSRLLDVPQRRIAIVSGAQSRRKRVRISDVSRDTVAAALAV